MQEVANRYFAENVLVQSVIRGRSRSV